MESNEKKESSSLVVESPPISMAHRLPLACKSTYIRSRRACDKFASTRVFLAEWRRQGGNVTIVLANLLEPGVWSVAGWVVGSTPDGRTSLWYSLTRIRAKRRRQGPIRLEFQAAFVTGDS